MKRHQLEALRDFGIEYLPAAQLKREQAQRFGISPNRYYEGLFLATHFTQGSATASAIEKRAAWLLQQLMLLELGHGYNGIENTIIEAAHDLISLTGTAIPWLPLPQESADSPNNSQQRQGALKEQHNPKSSKQAAEKKPSLEPGQFLTTKEAAKALGRKDQTLRSWASKQNGPILAMKIKGLNMWRSDDILALYNDKTVS